MSAVTMEELFQKASGGDRNALVDYAMRLMDGIDCERNTENAVQCLNRAVDMGSAEAATQLGICYAYGIGVKQDDAKSTKCFRKGAELGDPESMYRLFQNLSLGIGCGTNLEEADVWLDKAKQLGSAKAQEKWESFSKSGMLNERIRKEGPSDADEKDRLDKEEGLKRTVSSMISPREAYAVANADTEEAISIVSQDYYGAVGTKSAAMILTIYTIAGVLSGFLAKMGVQNGVDAFGAQSVLEHVSSNTWLTVFFVVLGAVVGFLAGFLVKLIYRRSALSILYYLPALAFPLVLLLLGTPGMVAVKFIGKLLYGLLTIVAAIFGVICLCGSLSGA